MRKQKKENKGFHGSVPSMSGETFDNYTLFGGHGCLVSGSLMFEPSYYLTPGIPAMTVSVSEPSSSTVDPITLIITHEGKEHPRKVRLP